MITIVFDTETTGLIRPEATDLSQQPYITEIFCLKVEESIVDDKRAFKVIDQFEHLLHVPVPLSKEITKITGLTDVMLSHEPTFGSIFPKLAEFFHGCHRMVAHNMSFDRQMLSNEIDRTGMRHHFPWPPQHICTVEKSMAIQQRRINLQKLHVHFFGDEFPDAHRAKNDVMPLYRCYKAMVRKGMIL